MFPTGWFFIESKCKSGMRLDVQLNSLKSDAKIIVSPAKDKDEDSQLWMYDDGYIINKNSGMVLDIQGDAIESNTPIIQYRRKMIESAKNQRWFYREDKFIYPQVNVNLCLDIKGNPKAGSTVVLNERKYSNNTSQRWLLIPAKSSALSDNEQNSEEYTFTTASYAL
ncbi:ricin B lectin domain-containing protein [Pilobolus umbonatus]|nr:ricin B lectin domain-containing protein [Pilobolus umbonatus]